MRGNREINRNLLRKLKRMKSRKNILVLIEFIMGTCLFIFGTYLMAKEGCLLGELSILGFEKFSVGGCVASMFGFFLLNLSPYIKLLDRIDNISFACENYNTTVASVLHSEELGKLFNKGQYIPLIMIGVCSVLYPYLVMFISGYFYTDCMSMWLLEGFSIFGAGFALCFLVYLRKMYVLLRISKCCIECGLR